MQEFLNIAPKLTLIVALIGLIMVIAAAIYVFRRWQITLRTLDTAIVLTELHQEGVYEQLDKVSESSNKLVDKSVLVNESIGDLQTDIEHLRWLLAKIPEAKDSFYTSITKILVPEKILAKFNENKT